MLAFQHFCHSRWLVSSRSNFMYGKTPPAIDPLQMMNRCRIRSITKLP
jgi:hypothetical protein